MNSQILGTLFHITKDAAMQYGSDEKMEYPVWRCVDKGKDHEYTRKRYNFAT